MKIRQYKDAGQPGYPTKRQFLDYGTVVGVAAIGLGSLVGGYADEFRLAGDVAEMPRIEDPRKMGRLRSTVPAPATVNYTIAAGDTLASIAKKMLGDEKKWVEITRVNLDLKPDELRAGQVLKIPSVAAATPAAPVPAILGKMRN
jgi:nucleoid-associated protein YgaU